MNKAEHQPVLNALVLAGGKSARMGQDKGMISWYEQPQRYHIADMLGLLCDEVYISCRPEQQQQIAARYNNIADTHTGKGPYGAILSALETYPDRAWLVVACDLPLINSATLKYLIDKRDTSYIATTYESPFDGLPEPLVTVWEPDSLPILQLFLSQGYSCPRKVLIRNSEVVKVIKPQHPDALLNANTPEEAARARLIIEAQKKSFDAG